MEEEAGKAWRGGTRRELLLEARRRDAAIDRASDVSQRRRRKPHSPLGGVVAGKGPQHAEVVPVAQRSACWREQAGELGGKLPPPCKTLQGI